MVYCPSNGGGLREDILHAEVARAEADQEVLGDDTLTAVSQLVGTAIRAAGCQDDEVD